VVENDQIALWLERQLFDLALQAIWVDGRIPEPILLQVLTNLYRAGYVVVLSTPLDATGWPLQVIQFSGDDAQNPERLTEKIQHLAAIR
jgi:hypothetical protein